MSRTKRKREEKHQLKWPYFKVEAALKVEDGTFDIIRITKYARIVRRGRCLIALPVEEGDTKDIRIFESDSGSKRFKEPVNNKLVNRRRRAQDKRELRKELLNLDYSGNYSVWNGKDSESQWDYFY